MKGEAMFYDGDDIPAVEGDLEELTTAEHMALWALIAFTVTFWACAGLGAYMAARAVWESLSRL